MVAAIRAGVGWLNRALVARQVGLDEGQQVQARARGNTAYAVATRAGGVRTAQEHEARATTVFAFLVQRPTQRVDKALGCNLVSHFGTISLSTFPGVVPDGRLASCRREIVDLLLASLDTPLLLPD